MLKIRKTNMKENLKKLAKKTFCFLIIVPPFAETVGIFVPGLAFTPDKNLISNSSF